MAKLDPVRLLATESGGGRRWNGWSYWAPGSGSLLWTRRQERQSIYSVSHKSDGAGVRVGKVAADMEAVRDGGCTSPP
jgi:hypothetical protein